MKQVLIGLFFCFHLQAAWFGYDRGIAAARQGDHEQAVTLLRDELTDQPENPSLLYDAGVLDYSKQEYAQAVALFTRAVEGTRAENPLHRQALFNLGNAYVGEKKLSEALKTYNQLLGIDPGHTKARHNRDKVKKMLEQQEKKESQGDQQQQEQQGGQSSDKDKQQQGNQQSGKKDSSEGGQQSDGDSSQDQSSQGSQSESTQSGQQQKGQQKKSSASQQQKKQEASSDQKEASQDASQAAENKECEPSQEQSSGHQDDQKGEGKDGNQLDERESYKERYGQRNNDADSKDEQGTRSDIANDVQDEADSQKGSGKERTQNHDRSPSHAPHKVADGDTTLNKTMNVTGKAQESGKKEAKKQYAAWAEDMLDAVQRNDEALNKVLVQRAVAGSLGGREGECCW